MVKQETLKEAADKYVDINYYNYIKPLEKEAAIENFIEGAQWQAEKMYSEEEVLELLQKALTHKDNRETGNLVTIQGDIRTANFYSWFEQFKKK